MYHQKDVFTEGEVNGNPEINLTKMRKVYYPVLRCACGDLFGEVEFYMKKPRSQRAVVISNSATLVVIHPDMFQLIKEVAQQFEPTFRNMVMKKIRFRKYFEEKSAESRRTVDILCSVPTKQEVEKKRLERALRITESKDGFEITEEIRNKIPCKMHLPKLKTHRLYLQQSNTMTGKQIGLPYNEIRTEKAKLSSQSTYNYLSSPQTQVPSTLISPRNSSYVIQNNEKSVQDTVIEENPPLKKNKPLKLLIERITNNSVNKEETKSNIYHMISSRTSNHSSHHSSYIHNLLSSQSINQHFKSVIYPLLSHSSSLTTHNNDQGAPLINLKGRISPQQNRIRNHADQDIIEKKDRSPSNNTQKNSNRHTLMRHKINMRNKKRGQTEPLTIATRPPLTPPTYSSIITRRLSIL